jgi:biopolymer transport protein ExbB/TolQ
MRTCAKVTVAGLVFFAGGILFGVGSTVFGMAASFHRAPAGTPADAKELSGGIYESLAAVASAIGVSFVGLCVAIAGVAAYLLEKRHGRESV